MMRFDVDLHRLTLKLPGRLANGKTLSMSAVDAGPRDALQTMVFIHGFGGRAAYWEYQLEQFQNDYRVIALDLRGHGYTDAPTDLEGARYDVPELVGDIEAALDALQVPQQFILVCHSFGGALSSWFMKQHPHRVTALVVVASAVRFHLRLGGRLLLRVPPKILTWVRALLPYVGFNAVRIYPPAHVVYLQNKNALATWDGTEYLRQIAVPTIVILGQRDILFAQESYEEVAQLIPNAEQVVIPVSAHQVMVERPDAVNRAIERFLLAQHNQEDIAESKSVKKSQRRAQRKSLEAERPWLKFYDARTPYQIRQPSVTLPRLLEATARRFATTPALHYMGRQMSWGELDKLASRFAHGLLAAGIKSGDKVMLALPNIPQWLIAYFGILRMGAIAVLVDGEADQESLLDKLAESESVMLVALAERHDEMQKMLHSDARSAGVRRVVLASMTEYMGWQEKSRSGLLRLARVARGSQGRSRFQSGRATRKTELRVTTFRHLLVRGRLMSLDTEQSVDSIAVVVYTHGTSGATLPVPLSHRNLAANALQLRHWLPESRPGDERFLAQQPLWTPYGLTCLLHLGVYLGATLILLPASDIAQLLKTVKKMQPTYFPTTPRTVRQLTYVQGVRRYGLASIRICAVSGSPLPQEIREEFEKITRGRLIEAYGLAEASPAAIAMPVAARRQSGVAGLPLPDTEAKILDLDSGSPVVDDAIGELWVRGPQVFAGYGGTNGQHDSASAMRLRDGWLATGDIASMDEDGFFTVIDRKANMLVRNDVRVFPRQIEDVLFEHPAVALAQVKTSTDENGKIQLRAAIVLHRNMQVTVEELFKYCSKRLHPSALPDSIAVDEPTVNTLT